MFREMVYVVLYVTASAIDDFRFRIRIRRMLSKAKKREELKKQLEDSEQVKMRAHQGLRIP